MPILGLLWTLGLLIIEATVIGKGFTAVDRLGDKMDRDSYTHQVVKATCCRKLLLVLPQRLVVLSKLNTLC